MEPETKTKSGTKQAVNFAGQKFINPLYVLAQIKIPEKAIVADFGCGAGYFSIPISQVVGEEGKVYCLDVLPQALEAVESKTRLQGIKNVVVKRTNLEKERGSGLDNESVDWVVLKDVLFQNKDKQSIIQEAYRVLKPEGKALIIEWKDHGSSLGPDERNRISSREISAMVKKSGFNIHETIDVGDFHYGMVVTK